MTQKETQVVFNEEIKKTIKNNNIVVGVSGGPDSIFLLNRLLELEHKKVVVAHVNYNLRKESKEESLYLKKNYSSKCIIETLNITTKPTSNKQSWARKIRFDFFKEVSKKHNTNIVFIGTTNNDLIESFFMREISKSDTPLFKESTIINGLQIYRPLFLTRKEYIINYLTENKIHYFMDATNSTGQFFRNVVRKKFNNTNIAPLITREVVSEETLTNWLTNVSETKYKKWMESGLLVNFLLEQDEVIMKEILRIFIKENFQTRELGKKIEGIYNFIKAKNYHKKHHIEGETFIIIKNKELRIINKDN